MTPEKIARAVQLYYDQNWTLRKIALELGTNTSAVHRAIRYDNRRQERAYVARHAARLLVSLPRKKRTLKVTRLPRSNSLAEHNKRTWAELGYHDPKYNDGACVPLNNGLGRDYDSGHQVKLKPRVRWGRRETGHLEDYISIYDEGGMVPAIADRARLRPRATDTGHTVPPWHLSGAPNDAAEATARHPSGAPYKALQRV